MKFWDECIALGSKARPEQIVLSDSRTSVSFRELEHISASLQARFDSLGLQTSDRVLMALPRSVHEALCFSALLRAGIAGLSIDRAEIAATLWSTVETFKPRGLIVLKSDEPFTRSLFSRSTSHELNLSGHNDPLQQLVLLLIDDVTTVFHPSEVGWFLQTSGSTGHRRIVMISQDNLKNRARQEVEDFSLRSDDVVLNALSFSHDLGLNQFLTTLISGMKLRIQNQPFATALAKELREEKPTGITGTPLLWSRLLQLVEKPFLSLRYATVSGGSLSSAKLRALQELVPNAEIIRTYGQTETFRSLLVRGIADSSQGRPIQNVRAEIQNSQGIRCAVDEVGELIHEGTGAMLGYFNEPHDSVVKMQGAKIRTGDLFFRDANGNFHYVGRSDDMIKRFEHRMHLSEVENRVRSFDEVQEVSVISQPSQTDDIRQNLICVFVEPKPGSSTDSEQILLKCKESLASFQVPDEVRLLTKLPRTVSFKIDRQALLKLWNPT